MSDSLPSAEASPERGLDKIDLRILPMLQADGRINNRELDEAKHDITRHEA